MRNDEHEIPREFRDFAGRHGLASLYSIWGISLYLAGFLLFGAFLIVGVGESLVPAYLLAALGFGLLITSFIARRRKMRADQARMAAYLRWRKDQVTDVGDAEEK
ncbi:hypothetical protein AB0H57_32275 [Micromonospora sp. NPDC050686]|uniref:hypothetical protein n=1 Tax=Micromonospora sp. NPDC050686 TaxID=3154631 RepID=UPI0033E0A960